MDINYITMYRVKLLNKEVQETEVAWAAFAL